MPEELKERVSRRLAELGRNPFEAARVGGFERSFVNDILNGKKRSVQGANLDKLAKALSWTTAELLASEEADDVSGQSGGTWLYKRQLADSDSIQVEIGDLRRAAARALRRADVSEEQAEAAASVLVATLSVHPNASVVVRLGETARTSSGLQGPEPVDQA